MPIYSALIAQSGTDAPTATELVNTLGTTVTWTRSSAGIYRGTFGTAFTTGNMTAPPYPDYTTNNQPVIPVTDTSVIKGYYTINPGLIRVDIECYNLTFTLTEMNTLFDGTGNGILVTIKYYA